MRSRAALLSSLLLVAACSVSTAQQTGATTGAGSGAGGATSTSASSGAGGIGFGGFPASGAGGAFACKEPDAAYFVELEGDGGPQLLASGCTEPMAWAHYFQAPAGGGGLEIYGCIAGSSVALDLNAGIMMIGSDNTITADYTDAGGGAWHTQALGTMMITAYGAAGDAVDGTFTVDVTMGAPGSDAGGVTSLSGSFHVCHRPDMLAP